MYDGPVKSPLILDADPKSAAYCSAAQQSQEHGSSYPRIICFFLYIYIPPTLAANVSCRVSILVKEWTGLGAEKPLIRGVTTLRAASGVVYENSLRPFVFSVHIKKAGNRRGAGSNIYQFTVSEDTANQFIRLSGLLWALLFPPPPPLLSALIF